MNLDNLKLIGLNIKDYLVDLVLILVVGLFTNFVINFLNQPLRDLQMYTGLSKSYDLFPLPIGTFKIAVWIITFLVIRWLMGKRAVTFLSGVFKNEYSFDADRKRKKLTERRLMKEWILQGNVISIDGGLLVSNSNSGCLIRPRGDKHPHQNQECNDECQEKFKKIFGIVFRAQKMAQRQSFLKFILKTWPECLVLEIIPTSLL